MTNEYKLNLLKYITGKVDGEIGVDEPTFSETFVKNSDYQEELDKAMPGYTFVIKGYLESPVDENIAIYGNFIKTGSVTIGGIMLLNQHLEVIQIITTFDSGTYFNSFDELKVDEEGYIFGIDSISGTSYRFIMLNNIFIANLLTKEYYVKLRSSYYLPTNLNFTYDSSLRGSKIFKNPNGADYCFYGTYAFNTTSSSFAILTLKISVGIENEWNIYTAPNRLSFANSIASIVSWPDNIIKIKFYGFGALVPSGSSTYSYRYMEWSLENKNYTLSYSFVYDNQNISVYNIFAKNESEVYVAYNNLNNMIIYVGYINKNNNNLMAIFTENLDGYFTGQAELIRSNNEIFVYKLLTKYVNNVLNYEHYIGMIKNNTYYEKYVTTGLSRAPVIISNTYNLYNLSLINTDNKTYITKLIYNVNNYNGLSYKDLSSFISNGAVLYDNENIPIFARNLYNKTINDNIITSTIEIPNMHLNNTVVSVQDLLSKNNNILISESNVAFSKNIYESVLLNFSNQINIVNENDISNIRLNPVGATYLVAAMEDTSNYNNAKAMKLKINYSDNTFEYREINAITPIDSNNTATYTITVANSLDNPIINLEIVSTDEKTSYQTIDKFVVDASKQIIVKQALSTPRTNTDFWYALSNTALIKATPLTDGWINIWSDGAVANTYVNFFTKRTAMKNPKPNTIYTLVAEFRNVINAGTGTLVLNGNTVNEVSLFTTQKSINAADIKEGNQVKTLITTKEDISGANIMLRAYKNVAANTSCDFDVRIMLVEGDYTNKNLQYEMYREQSNGFEVEGTYKITQRVRIV